MAKVVETHRDKFSIRTYPLLTGSKGCLLGLERQLSS